MAGTEYYKTSTDIEMLRVDEISPDEHSCSFELVNITHPGHLPYLQSSFSLNPDVSLAFRLNGRDCFFNNHDFNGAESDHEVPRQDCTQKAQIVHHHFHHFLPVRPKLVAPPLQVVPVIEETDFNKNEEHTVPSSPECLPDIKMKSLSKKNNSNGQECAHCNTDTTSLWRRVEDRLMCNACALYLKLHGANRPLHLNTGVIKRRNRVGGSLSRRSRKH